MPPNRKLVGLGHTSWNVLKQTLKITQDLSDNFLPLHVVVTGLLVIMDHIEVWFDRRSVAVGNELLFNRKSTMCGQISRILPLESKH